jgi:hypothetical protein
MLEQSKPMSEFTGQGAPVIPECIALPATVQAEITVPDDGGDEPMNSLTTAAMAATVEVLPAPAAVAPVEAKHRADGNTGNGAGGDRSEMTQSLPDIDEPTELLRTEAGGPPTELPPSSRMESAGDLPEPTLEPGVVLYGDMEAAMFGEDDDVFTEGMDDAGSGYDPSRPDVGNVSAGQFAVGRAGGEFERLAFEGGSEGCRIITMANGAEEGALLHVDVADMGTTAGEDAIDAILSVVPSLGHPVTAAKIFGDVETSPQREPSADWNDRLKDHLRSRGITNIEIITEGRGKDVILHVRTGEVKATDLTGRVVYPPEV